jgi:hypothetical protein
MKLTAVHQILVASAVALAGLFALRSLWMFTRSGQALDGVLAAVGAALGVAAVLYLRAFRRKLAGNTVAGEQAQSR